MAHWMTGMQTPRLMLTVVMTIACALTLCISGLVANEKRGSDQSIVNSL